MNRYCEKILRLIIKFCNMSRSLKVIFIKAVMYTAYFRVYILFKSFKSLKSKMGKVKEESAEEVNENDLKAAKKISWIVNTVAKYTPWESKCLVQALTAQKLLRDKRISSTLYLGVAKDEKNEMIAHAWIRCGQYYVTGGDNRNRFAVVAKFCAQ